MTKASDLCCYHGVSQRLAKLLCRADDNALATIRHMILTELKRRSSFQMARSLVQACLENDAGVSEEQVWKAKEVLALELEKGPDNSRELEHDDVIIDVCWGFSTEETLLGKCDAMIYQVGGLPNHERNEMIDLALNATIGWHSAEWGM